MKTCSARCLIRFVTAVALLFAVLVPASFAEDSAALNKPEKLIGKWKSVGDPISLEGAKMVVSFAENGEFALSITGESGRKSEHKGTYSAVTAPGGYLKVTMTIGEHKDYSMIRVLPDNELIMRGLKSPDEPAKFDEETITLIKVP